MGLFLKWFFIIAPFIYFDGVLDASGTPRLLFLSVSLLLGYSASLFSNTKLCIPKNYTFIYLSYILVLFFSAMYNTNYIDYVEIINRIEYFMFFILVYSYVSSNNNNRNLLKGIVTFSVIIISIGVIQLVYLTILKQGAQENLYAISSVFSHKNIYASVLVLSIPFLIIADYSKKSKILLVSFTFLFLIILQTRSALLALLVSSIYFAFSKNDFLNKNKKLISLAGFVVLLTSVLLLKQLNTFEFFVTIFDFDRDSLRSSTIKERFFLWGNSLKMFCDNWLLGLGVGQWAICFPIYGLSLWRLRQGEVVMQRPHNDMLENFTELGIVGGVIFLLILIYPLLIKAKTSKEQLIKFGLISFIIISFFSFPQERIIPSLMFFTFVAFSLKDKKSINIGTITKIIISGLLIVFVFVSYNRLGSERIFKKYITNLKTTNSKEALLDLHKAKSPFFKVEGTSTPIDWYIGEVYFKNKNILKAKEYFENALIINPNKINILNSLGGCSLFENDLLSAEKYFQKAIDIAPFYEVGLYNLAYVMNKKFNYSSAIYVLRDVYDKSAPKFQKRILEYAKSEIKSNSNASAPHSEKKSILDNLYYNEAWIREIVQKSFLNNETFKSQLNSEVRFLLEE